MLTKHTGIQAWRGVAVLLVVLHHFETPFFSGGLIGVDIFFVISGFIITEILFKTKLDLKAVKNFYYKRIVRIYPSLIIALLIAVVLSALFQPENIMIYGKDSLYILANIYNISLINNFNELTAIQHLWSISVEMQFYIILPLIFLILNKQITNKTTKINITILALSMVSFIYYNYMLLENISISYYSLTARFWEMGIGIMLSINLPKIRNYFGEANLFAKQILPYSLIGLYLLTYTGGISLFQYLPIIAISLVIIYNYNDNSLSSKVLNKIGDISYQIYLFHWIIWFFLKEYLSYFPALLITVLVTIALSYFSNYKIDANLRKIIKIS